MSSENCTKPANKSMSKVLIVTAGGTEHINCQICFFYMLKACLRALVGNASSLLSVCPCVQLKEFNTK